MDDLQYTELDADETHTSISGPQAVRKTISLNLTKSSKLKSKMEKRDRDESSRDKSTEAKISRRDINVEIRRGTIDDDGREDEELDTSYKVTLKKENNNNDDREDGELNSSYKVKFIETTEIKRETTDDDDRKDEKLDLSHKVNFVEEKIQNPMIHICEKCSLTALMYGRLSPCKHVFCLLCAEKLNGVCSHCEKLIERIDSVQIGKIFLCSFDGCRTSYLSKRDLLAHIKHRHEKKHKKSYYLNVAQNMMAQPTNKYAKPAGGLNNTVMIPFMAAPSQPPMYVNSNAMTIIAPQPWFQPMPQSTPMTQYPTQMYMPQNQAQYYR